ncbi:MAG: sulfatase [Fimbriimonadaceae bacterium]|nr:sulfatase [Fimbriimonadaceae bacterium]
MTTRRTFLRAAGATLLSTAARLPSQPAPRRPNLVVIYCDDLGSGDLACFGSPTNRTPHLDQMAAEGLRLRSFYSVCPVCSASRYGLLTGRYQLRSGFVEVMFPQATNGLRADEVTLADLLRGAGYRTQMIGKWHLGHRAPFLPLRHGFEHWLGIPYSNDMDVAKRGDPPLPLYQDDTVLETRPDQTQLTRRYTAAACDFLRARRDEPFFLYLAHAMPHQPLHASADFRGKSAGGLYGDVVEELDWSVGQVLACLRETGLDEQTLVVFSSDNGAIVGSNKPYRGRKGTTWEGGVRVPTIARWPGRIAAGGSSEVPASTLDLLPTCCALTGTALPQRELDGVDLSGLLLHGAAPARPDVLGYHHGLRLKAVRDERWKLHLLPPDKDLPAGDLPLLYDLHTDPQEQRNLAAEQPAVVARLRERAAALAARVVKAPPAPDA